MSLLEELYGNRYEHAAADAASGTPVIGLIGAEVPPELVRAAGARALRLHGAVRSDPSRATELLGRAVDEEAVMILSPILDGQLEFLRGILVANDCEASLQLFYALRELHRLGAVTPAVHLVDQRHLDRPSTLRYNIHQLHEAVRVLSEWTGVEATDARLVDAVRESAHLDVKLHALQRLRRSDASEVTGLDVLHAYGVATAMTPAMATDAIDAAAAALASTGGAHHRLRIFCTGSAPIGDDLYRIIEGAGAIIVGEDHAWGELALVPVRRIEPGEGKDEVISLLAASRLAAAGAAPTRSSHRRAAHTADAVRASGAQALLAIVRAGDDAPAWDFPRQRDAVDVPAVLLERQRRTSTEDVAHALSLLRSAA